MDFFERFKEAEWEFTFGDPDDIERINMQVGLTATFYIDQCYLPQKRKGLAEALALYHRHFGEHLRWAAFDHKEHKKLDEKSLSRCMDYLQDQGKDVSFLWSSESPGWQHVGSYAARALSMQGWFEQVHKDLSYFSFYLPIEALKDDGRARFEKLLLDCCTLLQPLHGLSGLGMQVCYENEEFQDLEFETAENFTCIDIGTILGSKRLREGFRSVNWYTILADQWLDKLGGQAAVRHQLNDDRIALLPFPGGVMIRAGDWPELGWIRRDPYPELYVKVNDVLRPARAPEVNSFHFGSIGDEVRFDPDTSNEWLKRFDAAGERLREKVRQT